MFELISIGKRALQNTEKAIETTSHNISNMNTPGYSRQRVVQESGTPIDLVYANIGTGAYIEKIERMRDIYTDVQFRQAQTDSGYWGKMSDEMQQLENSVLEPSDNGIGEKINTFFDKWDALAANPTTLAYRNDVVQAGVDLTEGFKDLYQKINEKQNELNTKIEADIDSINQIAQEASHLLTSISESEGQNKEANDLRDRFDYLMDELSKYGDVQIQKREYGQTIIYFGTDELARNSSARELTADYGSTGEGETVGLKWKDGGDMVNGLKSGEVKALLDLRDTVLSGYKEELDNQAVNIAQRVNELHLKGYDNNATPERGHLFFDDNVTGVRDLNVTGVLINNPNNVAVSLSGEKGDNRVALDIANLRSSATYKGQYTASEAYGNLLYEIGNDINTAKSNADSLSMSRDQLNNFRESVKGVSLNEETANLLKYQQIYQAAAKIISIADEMTKLVIGLVQ